MARYRRGDQLELPLAESLVVDGREWSADLIAKRATGVEGYRMTVAFLPAEGSDGVFVELDPAETRDEARGRAEELAADSDRLEELLRRRP